VPRYYHVECQRGGDPFTGGWAFLRDLHAVTVKAASDGKNTVGWRGAGSPAPAIHPLQIESNELCQPDTAGFPETMTLAPPPPVATAMP
jgi:hypothetical protein